MLGWNSECVVSFKLGQRERREVGEWEGTQEVDPYDRKTPSPCRRRCLVSFVHPNSPEAESKPVLLAFDTHTFRSPTASKRDIEIRDSVSASSTAVEFL